MSKLAISTGVIRHTGELGERVRHDRDKTALPVPAGRQGPKGRTRRILRRALLDWPGIRDIGIVDRAGVKRAIGSRLGVRLRLRAARIQAVPCGGRARGNARANRACGCGSAARELAADPVRLRTRLKQCHERRRGWTRSRVWPRGTGPAAREWRVAAVAGFTVGVGVDVGEGPLTCRGCGRTAPADAREERSEQGPATPHHD